jgi:hypothetical protein
MKTTIEISTPLLRRARRIAARDKTTLRRLVEDGLVTTLKAREQPSRPVVYEPLIFVGGSGMSPEFRDGGWENIRDALYDGRGA